MPGFIDDPEACCRERSAICWPEALRVPILLLHGDADTRVNVMQSIRLAGALEAIGHPHELVIYKGDDHFLSRNWNDSLTRMGSWLQRHAQQ
jgi:dipeptidyl aminopeptidase/acylaminoacyl peptidase